jgi:hypothetical protein
LISDSDLKDINPAGPISSSSPAHVSSGVPIPKAARVRIFSPDEWEEFIEEWASSLKAQYKKVRRFGGSGDLGVDIAVFYTDKGYAGEWDNYQCKRYDHPLRPSDIWVEIGKVIYYSFLSEYKPPSHYYFVCSQDIGTSLEKLLNNHQKLKEEAENNWDKHCLTGITSTTKVPLAGPLFDYFDEFDFSIFTTKSHVELIEGHSMTGFHAVRFGGGLPPRPLPELPPEFPDEAESRYIRQLLDAYGDHLGTIISDPSMLNTYNNLKRDYLRQRERFYHAESLRNFARDTVPDGTFSALQDEIFHGVVDVCESSYSDGFERMKATVAQASNIAINSNPLSSAVKTQDRQGICHQLANEDHLKWVPQIE